MDVLCEVYNNNRTDWSFQQLCHTELLNIVCFGFYAYVALLILLYLRCSNKRRTSHSSELFAGHSLRAILSLLLFLTHLTELCDTLLGSRNVLKLLGPGLALLAWILSQLFYAQVESKSEPRYLILTGIFWMCCGLARGISLYRLLDLGLGIQHVRPHCVALGSTLCYALAFNDIVTVLYQVHLLPQKDTKNAPNVFESYKHTKAAWYSKFTFYWLIPLLRAGYANPLELEDLGQIPVKETAQRQYAAFSSVYNKEKEHHGLQVSLWKCYALCYWHKFLLGGLFKLLGDGVGFIPPLGISVIIQYVDTDTTLPARNALVYKKALCLSSCNKDDDSFQESKTGNMTNLIAEDAYNIMSCYWIGHYVWAIPLKICILMYLLYSKLGISAIIGASCCIIILTPLQFIIGKKMSVNSKLVSDCSDERLRQTNEVLQGIKLLKLYGWESDFTKRILTTRKKELKLLNLDSLYWALMTFLTQASSVLITLVTLAAFCILGGSSLSPSDVFSGLALFNQLTVPLFIFPITVPIIISALVSTKRIEEFLSMPETVSVIPPAEEVKVVQTKKTDKHSDLQFKCHSNTDSVFGLENITEIEEPDDNMEKMSEHHGNSPAIVINDAAFSWGEKVPTLNVSFLSIPRGKLTMVIGHIGSGKSSLLSAMLGEMQCTKGTVTWDSGLSVAYVAQKSWLLNGSLRDNVLFGRPYRAHRYNRVIAATALQPDIDILPEKDMTDIGERGINLSGGQRQRIAIARALYSRANIVILDDPLSALDYQVAQHVFLDGIIKIVKQKRTVIMVTHSLQLLPHSHQVVVMEDGNVKISGSFTEVEKSGISFVGEWQTSDEAYKGRTARERWQLIRLVSRIGQQLKQRNLNDGTWAADDVAPPLFVPFRKRLGTFSGSRYLAHDLPLPTDECDEEELMERRRRACTNVALQLPRHRAVLRATSLQAGQPHFNPVMRQSSSPSIHNTSRPRIYTFDATSSQSTNNSGLLRHLFSISTQRSSGSTDQDRSTIQRLSSTTSDCSDEFVEDDETLDNLDWGMSQSAQEEREYGKIQRKIYLTYLSACGIVMGSLYIASILSWQGLRVYTDFWLTKWTQDSASHTKDEMLKYLCIYGGLSVASILLSLVSNCLGQYCGARARKQLHDTMLLGLISCPVRFFETTPLGRIMNRFSTDLGVIDKKIATSIQRLLQFLLLCFSAVIINAVVTPWFLIVAVPLCLVYYVAQKFYRCSSRELQRLDSMSRAPILSHFSETLDGLETIRAFNQQKRFMSVFFHKLDTHTNTFLIINSCNRWLGIALDYLGGIIVFVAMITSLATASLLPGLVTPALVGLAINYTLLVPIYLNWVVKFLADMEMYMGAVERVSQYATAPSEDYRTQGTVPKSWPQKGDIKFQGVSLRYDTNREPVITNMNLYIPAGQKVGICGRTGSGKSSLVMSLFNMVSVSEGNIYIDGIDISAVPVRTLRSHLSVIPQDVIMFSGTIRENLDLRGEYSDAELWACLELAQMKESVSTQLGGLGGIVREGGENLSAGQRQLLCLARAILHNASCLVMDEATSSLDPTTEKKLLQAATESFATRTIFTIAHRLSSLLNCDRILVLESGRIVEDGSPSQLLSRSMGIFSTMLRSAEDSN